MMSKKRLCGLLLMLVLLSSTVLAVSNSTTCSGFWGSVSCFLWGSAENRAGKGWFDRTGNVVGGANE